MLPLLGIDVIGKVLNVICGLGQIVLREMLFCKVPFYKVLFCMVLFVLEEGLLFSVGKMLLNLVDQAISHRE